MALLNGRPKCSLQITQKHYYPHFTHGKTQTKKSQIFIYEPINLNESFCTEIYTHTQI